MSIQITAAGNGYSQVEVQKAVSSQVKPDVKILEAANAGASEAPKREFPDIVADLEKITVAFNKKLKYEVNHESNDIIVKVIDPETDKVIKVLPPKELQRLHTRIKETIGFLFDERI